MRGAIHLLAILLAALSAGCATSVDVAFEEGEDLSGYRTWDWFPGGRSEIEATGAEAAALDVRVARHIEKGLLAKGFVRGGEGSDFFVAYRLAFHRRPVVVDRASAQYHLSSYGSQGSFLVESSQKETRVYREMSLSIGVTGARGRVLWRARLAQQEEEGFALKLDDAVAILLDRLPSRRPRCGGNDPATETPAGVKGSDRELRPDEACPDGDVDPEPAPPEPRFRRWAARARLTGSDIW